MIRLKTAVLPAACLKIGALIGGANEEQAQHLYNLGINVGLAFQLQDDYLEFIASVLSKGEDLPQNIVNRYLKYHNDNLIPDNKKGFQAFIKYIKRMINF